MDNYFAFYDLPLSFVINEGALKKKFYAFSRQYHPDFYTLESAEKQAEILELSTFNTEAYKTLSDFDKRIKYVLEIKAVLGEEGDNKLPQDFLMDMMDLNESLIELEIDYDPNAHQKIMTDLQTLENQLFESVKDILENYQDEAPPQYDLEKIKDFYLKKRYFLRVKENLSKFAPL
ncbi:MAG: hypothetical protein HC817_15170 [Saprospiraceae bacterium]|nr:hypothetical protein [Saprospiraceae bacterium]